jgi:hypothetical protein
MTSRDWDELRARRYLGWVLTAWILIGSCVVAQRYANQASAPSPSPCTP